MRKLYKLFPAYNKGYLQVSDLHKIYYEESGNPKGKPVIVFHGGPGSHSKPKYRKFFNPKKWRVVMFDQRGCGKSTPRGELKENTTWDLVDDTEKLRKHLGIDEWVVFGGSWGSTLGLAYSGKNPQSVNSLILRGIWLCRQEDMEWLFGGRELKRLFPDLWEERAKNIKRLGIKGNTIKGLYRKLINGTAKEQKLASKVFEDWEGQFMTVTQLPETIHEEDMIRESIDDNKILAYYMVNNCFLKKNQLLNDTNKIKDVSTVIIHGRYDVICPLDNAWVLHKKLPKSKLEIVPAAGHHSSEPGTIDKLVEYTDKFAEKI